MSMNGFGAVVLLAIVVAGLVEYAKSVIRMFTKRDYKRGITQLAALVCSDASHSSRTRERTNTS